MDEKTQDLWSQFQEMTALHKFYFEIIIKGASFAMGIIGAIITYAVAASASEDTSSDLISILLLFPTIISGGSAVIFLLGTWKAWDLSNNVQKMQRRLNFEWRPHAELLVWMSAIFGLLFFLTTLALFWVIANPGVLQEIIAPG